MFLKTLSVKGFKSFADPTVMHLEPGVTVVVGPNGSGKSNVVDAVAWVLGAQAPSAVRSQKMDDVIFAGTAGRPALGRAEVSLTIDNSAGLLDIGFTEITVSRILFRTGDSEYSINGVPCRLLDVQELLSDAGVGRQQHVIVSQGQIDAVLNARPEERRAIVEEAAGVLKFRKRKEKSERRLASTEASLLRLTDLLREVRRGLRPLERQADAARRHGFVVDELTALRIHVAGRQVAALRAALGNHAAARLAQERTEAEIRTTLTRLDAEVLALEAELSIRNSSDVNDRLMRVDHLCERARGLLALVAERRRSVERDATRTMDATLIASLEGEVAERTAEIATVDAEIARHEPERDELVTDELAFADERRGVLNLFGGDPSVTAASAAAELRGELRSLRAGVARAEADHRRSADRHDHIAHQTVDLRVEIDRRRDEIERLGAEHIALGEALDGADAALAAAEMAEAVAASELERAAAATSRWSARIEALQLAIDAAHSRSGAKAITDVDGVVGVLLDLIRIDVDWAPAVTAALGEALESVVVADVDAATSAVEALRAGGAAAGLLTIGRPAGVAATWRAPGAPLGDPIRPHVTSRDGVDPGIDQLLDRLLAGAVRVASTEAAIGLLRDRPDAIVVTETGDRFDALRWRIGTGGDDGTTSAALDEAVAESARSADLLVLAKGAAESALVDLDRAREHQRLAQRALDVNRAAHAAGADALDRTRHQLHELDAELERLGPGIAEQEEHLAAERARIVEMEALVPSLEADEEAAASARRDRSGRVAALDARAAMLAGRRRDLEVHGASLHERKRLLTQRIAEIDDRLAADVASRREAGELRLALTRTVSVLEALHTRIDGHRRALDVEHAILAERRRVIGEQVGGHAARLDQARLERADAEHRLEETRERSRRIELDETETRLRLEGVVDTLRRDLSVEPDAAEQAAAPELPDGVTAAVRVRELERELRLMGPINPLALEEFNELQERHAFLEGQLDDVRSTRRELRRVIAAVDREIEIVFTSAFADVSEHFTALFSTLFPGGRGRLVLTQPDDVLESGIEVEAKPSGKNVKKLSLLSGGERSLTALAFLFAVFRSRPSPFYVMDEVEAALDDVNLHRFLGLLAEFRTEAQLLVVSHQKRTMEAADCLLGVSMQPGGSSKVVAERITESGELADPDDPTSAIAS